MAVIMCFLVHLHSTTAVMQQCFVNLEIMWSLDHINEFRTHLSKRFMAEFLWLEVADLNIELAANLLMTIK